MFNKSKILLLFLLVLAIGTVSTVGAADINNDTVSDSATEIAAVNENNNVIQVGDIEDASLQVSDGESDVLKDDTWSTFTTLQDMIDTVSEGQTLTLNANFYREDDFSSYLYINKPMVIDGAGHTIDSCQNGGMFIIRSDNVYIYNLNLINAYDEDSGAAVYIRGDSVMFNNCRFINNTALGSGGAIDTNCFTIFDGCYFDNNYAGEDGGAIYAYYPSYEDVSLYITNSIFRNNFASGNGGAVYMNAFKSNNDFVNGAAKSLINTTIFYNNEADYGGAVFNFQDTDVIDSDFVLNNARQGGGAIYMNNGFVVDDDDGLFTQTFRLNIHGKTSFLNNTAERYGGAIKAYAEPDALSHGIKAIVNVYDAVLFAGNSAKTGGALSIIDSNSKVENAAFYKNSAESGSAMEGGSAVSCIFEENDGPATSGVEIIEDLQAKLLLKQSGTYYKGAALTVTLTNSKNGAALAGRKVSVSVGGNTVTLTTDSKGVATYDLDLTPGRYLATAKVAEAGIEASSVSLNDVNIVKAPITITPTKLSTTYASGKYFQVKVINSNTKKAISGAKVKLQVYTGKKAKTVTVTTGSDGIAKYDTSKLSIGTHKVVVSNAQTSYFTGAKKTSSIKISKASYNIVAPKVTNAYKQSAKFTIKVKNKASGKAVSGVKLTVKVYTGKKYKSYSLKTNSKGEATINTKALSKGSHKIAISTKATTNYKAASKTSSASIVSQIPTDIYYEPGLIFHASNYGGHSHTYSVTVTPILTDSSGNALAKPVTLKHSDGYTETGTSGESITVSGSRPGTLTLIFAGDSKYAASSYVINLGNEPF